MPLKHENNRPDKNDPAADSPTRFIPAFKRFMAMIEWPPEDAKGTEPGESAKKRMKLEPRPSIQQPKHVRCL